jgi:hypothetical protein
VTYQGNVVPAADRQSTIVQAPLTGRSLGVHYRSRLEDFNRVRIPIGTPIYRMANIRTIVKQMTYLNNNPELADDFFDHGQEDVTAQRAQHELLVELSKDPKANIYGLLEQRKEQSEPLLITSTGVVLNGNRRLAAMRDLFGSKPQEYRSFEHVEVAVLPAGATEDDLAQIETDLQIAPDMRLDYGWVEQALGLKHQLNDLGWSLDKAANHWQSTRAELNTTLSTLTLSEEFLDHIGERGRYEKVADDKLAFERLAKIQQARSDEDPSRLEAERLIVFAELANSDEVEGRIYDHVGSVDELLEKVLVDPEVGLPTNTDGTGDGATAVLITDDDLLNELPDERNGVSDAVLAKLRDTTEWPKIATAANRANLNLKEEKRQAKRVNQFAADAAQLNAVATRLSLQNAKPETLPAAAQQLVSAVKEITDRLVDLRTDYPQSIEGIDTGRISEAATTLASIAEQSSTRAEL